MCQFNIARIILNYDQHLTITKLRRCFLTFGRVNAYK
jgi:hypothetical protein